MNKIDIYLNELHIQEDIASVLPKIDSRSYIKKLKGSVNLKDPVGSMKKVAKLAPPGLTPNVIKRIDKVASEKYANYKKLQTISSRVVKNSIANVSDQMSEIAGSFLVISSMFSKGKKNITHEANLKIQLKEFVTRVRKFGEDYDEEEKKNSKIRPSDYADLSVAWVVVVMSTALAVGIGGGTYIFLKVVAASIAASMGAVMMTLTWAVIAIVFGIICAMLAGRALPS